MNFEKKARIYIFDKEYLLVERSEFEKHAILFREDEGLIQISQERLEEQAMLLGKGESCSVCLEAMMHPTLEGVCACRYNGDYIPREQWDLPCDCFDGYVEEENLTDVNCLTCGHCRLPSLDHCLCNVSGVMVGSTDYTEPCNSYMPK